LAERARAEERGRHGPLAPLGELLSSACHALQIDLFWNWYRGSSLSQRRYRSAVPALGGVLLCCDNATMAVPDRRMLPQESIEAECTRRGKQAVISGCISLLAGEGADDGLIAALGVGATAVLAQREGGRGGYRLRVYAAQ